MKPIYYELWARVVPENEDLWSCFCFEQGALGLETLEESLEGTVCRAFFDSGVSLSFLESLISEFSQEFPFLEKQVTLLEVKEQENQDWQDSWKVHFHCRSIGQTLCVSPPWEAEQCPSERHCIVIDPGQGFGTGYHPSTLLALETLEQYLLQVKPTPEQMLDIGIGSGILAFAACYLGVHRVDGVDIESEAIDDTSKNAMLNSMSDQVYAQLGDPKAFGKTYPLVVSNMMAHELLGVLGTMVSCVASEGVLLCSGILEKQYDEFQKAVEAYGFQKLHAQSHEGWYAITFRRIS